MPINFNLLAYDPDGDSLAYNLVTPLRKDASNAITPVPGYSFPGKTYSCGSTIGAPVSVFSLDSLNGQVTWDAPCRQGEYIIAIVVQEWRVTVRGGKRIAVKLGEVTYDMQILTTFEPEARILLLEQDKLQFSKDRHILAKTNQETELKIYYIGLTLTDAPVLEGANTADSLVAGELSQVFKTRVTYTLEDAEYGTIATFRFTPADNLIRHKPYFISFYGKKGNYHKTQSFGVKVRSDKPVMLLNGESNLPKTSEGHLIASTNKAAKYTVFAENMPAHTLKLSVESTLAEAAEQFDFTFRDSTDGKVGALLFIPSESQINDEPQTIIFKATYTPAGVVVGRLSGTEPIVKEVRVQVVVKEQKPNALPDEIALSASKVYPNPVHSSYSVKVEKPVTFSVYNIQGKLILQRVLLHGITNLERAAKIKAGIYFYTITDSEGHKKTGKLVFN